MQLRLLVISPPLFFLYKSYSQCDSSLPTFNVDLAYSLCGTWNSPNIARKGNCCGHLLLNPVSILLYIIKQDWDAYYRGEFINRMHIYGKNI